MRLLEHQAKQLYADVGIPIPESTLATTVDEARTAADEIGYPVMVKAQVPENGRMKAGGVKRVETPADLGAAVDSILGMQIKDSHTRKVLIERAIEFETELYLGVIMDRAAGRPVAMVSTQGGVEVETDSKQSGTMHREHIDPAYGLQNYQARRIVYEAGVNRDVAGAVIAVLRSLYDLWTRRDGTETEINPLVVTPDRDICAVDAVFNIDPDAAYRQPTFQEHNPELEHADKLERKAAEYDFDYVRLDGTIGIVGNGAGLIMATQDLVERMGGSPANFLDIGGGASAQRVADALDMVFSDPNVTVVLMNIFGGITRCDQVATGINQALAEYETLPKPVIVRLAGTNVDAGRAQLDTDRVIAEQTLEGAVQTAVTYAEEQQ